MKLFQQITKPVSEMFADQGAGHSEEESHKRKFVVTLKGKDGTEIEKNCKAYSISDIKAHYGQSFVSAEVHPDEKRYASDDEEDDDRTSDEMDADAELEETMHPGEKKKKDFDFQRMMAGAMSRDEYNKKWKIGKYAPPKNKLAGPGGVYKNLLVKLGEAAAPDEGYGAMVVKFGFQRAKAAGTYRNKDVPGSGTIRISQHGHWTHSDVGTSDATKDYEGTTVSSLERHLKAEGFMAESTQRARNAAEAGRGQSARDVDTCKPPVGLDAEEKFAYRKGWQNPDDTPEDWEFKSSSKQGKAFMRGRSDCKGVDESIITEMAKRTSPAEFYKMAVKKHGEKNAGYMSWAMIKAVADENDILIPAYIRDNKIGRGVWDAKPKDMKAAAHEPAVDKKDEPKAAPSKAAVDRTTSRMAADAMAKSTPAKKDEPKKAEEPKGAPVPEKKEHYEKHDFPDTEFAWTTTYHEPRDLYAAIKQHHGVEHTDTQRVQVGKSSTGRFGVVLATYYILKKGTQDVLGRWTVTGGDKIPGRGFVAYGEGNIAMSKKAIKNRDDNMYGFLVKPQHGSPFISVGTQHSHGPWDKFSAEANMRDKYEHYAYDDEFGHGTIQVVKVVKKNGQWERA